MSDLKSCSDTTAIVLSFLTLMAGTAPSCLAETPSAQQFVEEGKYVEAIRSLDRKWRAAGALSPQQLRLYLDAYYRHGKQLLEKGDLNNARSCFLRVIQLAPRHADSHFQLGILEKRAKNYQKALAYLRSAISLHSQHSPEAHAAIVEIAKECLSAAEKAIAEGQAQAARAYLTLVSSNFSGEQKSKALNLAMYKLVPLERAAHEYARATRLLAAREKSAAVRILQDMPQSYPGTFFAPKASQLLQELGETRLAVRTSEGLELPHTWKMEQSAHFEVYYQKGVFFRKIIAHAEKALQEIFASLGYSKPTWKKKCKIYLFRNLSDWRKFLKLKKDEHLLHAGGFANTAGREIFLYDTKKDPYTLEHILTHELTHVVHASLVGGLSHVPLWLQEGLAVWHEKWKNKEIRRTLRLNRRSNLYLPLTELLSMDSYPENPYKNEMFYLESAGVVDLIMRKFGRTKMREIVLAYRRRVSFDAVLNRALGISMKEFEKLWKWYVQ